LFSELVDECIARSGRADMRSSIIGFAFQTQRELESKRAFHKNRYEVLELTAGAAPFIWTPPSRMQIFETARYSNGIYPVFMQPGHAMRDRTYFYYRDSTTFVFSGVTNVTSIAMSYFRFNKKLPYFDGADRPAVWDATEETWTYHADYDVSAATRTTAQELVSNWLLRDWNELMIEGTLAKIFKLVQNTERAATHYSFFKNSTEDQFIPSENHAVLQS